MAGCINQAPETELSRVNFLHLLQNNAHIPKNLGARNRKHQRQRYLPSYRALQARNEDFSLI